MKFYIAGNCILQLNDKSCSFKKQTERDVDLDWQKPDFQSQVCTWSSRVSTNIQEAKSVLTPVRAATPCQESLSSSSDFVCERIKTNAFLFPRFKYGHPVKPRASWCWWKVFCPDMSPQQGSTLMVCPQRGSVGIVWLYNSHPGRDSLSWGGTGARPEIKSLYGARQWRQCNR